MRALCACQHMVQQVGGWIRVRVSHCVLCCSRRICVRSHEHHAFPFMQQQWKFWGQQLEAATLWRTSHANTTCLITIIMSFWLLKTTIHIVVEVVMFKELRLLSTKMAWQTWIKTSQWVIWQMRVLLKKQEVREREQSRISELST